jgi:hypothetical protein
MVRRCSKNRYRAPRAARAVRQARTHSWETVCRAKASRLRVTRTLARVCFPWPKLCSRLCALALRTLKVSFSIFHRARPQAASSATVCRTRSRRHDRDAQLPACRDPPLLQLRGDQGSRIDRAVRRDPQYPCQAGAGIGTLLSGSGRGGSDPCPARPFDTRRHARPCVALVPLQQRGTDTRGARPVSRGHPVRHAQLRAPPGLLLLALFRYPEYDRRTDLEGTP